MTIIEVMLTIIVTKLLLSGAIKTFIVKPIINATMTVIPQSSVVQATMLNCDVLISTGDLIKFGAEILYDKFVGRKLDFQVDKLSKYVYGVTPADEFAALFSKQYADDQELIIDLTKFEDYLDEITGLSDKVHGTMIVDSEVDNVLNKVIEDLDLAINMSEENTFHDIVDEQLLIERILEKNQRIVQERDFQVGSDLPKVPKRELSNKEEIEKILSKF